MKAIHKENGIEIVKVRLNELDTFLKSKRFSSLQHNIPITPYRALSYLNNPRANPDDVILFMLFKQRKLLSYRSILSDELFTNGKKLHVGWFSGNWTHPKHRRKGYSSLLLKEVRKDWEDRLLFSNYAPASKDVLDQTEGFSLIKILKGHRYYFKFCLSELLPPKSAFFKKLKPLLTGTDQVLNRLISNKESQEDITWEKFSTLTQEDIHFISKSKYQELFRRTKEEYDWISQFPWIKTTDEARKWATRYYFSCYAHHFDLSFYRIMINDELEGILMVSIKDKLMKVQYAYLNEVAVPIASKCLLQFANSKNALHLTVFHKGLIKELNNLTKFYLFRKNFDQAFWASKKVIDQYPDIRKMVIQKGDGDAVFT